MSEELGGLSNKFWELILSPHPSVQFPLSKGPV